MLWFVWFLLGVTVGSLVLFHLLAWLIVWYSWRKFQAIVTVGSVGFFAFRNIVIVDRKGNRITIESVWCSSGLFSNDVQKTLSICLDGVHVFKSALPPPTDETAVANNESETSDTLSKPPITVSSTLLLLMQQIGITIYDVEIHTKNDRIQWDLILSNARINVSHCDQLNSLEFAISNVTLHGRDVSDSLIFVLSFQLNLSFLISKSELRDSSTSLVQNLDIKVYDPRGFVKEELLTLLAEQRAFTEERNSSVVKAKGKTNNLATFLPTSANVAITNTSFVLSRDEDCRNVTLVCQKLSATIYQSFRQLSNVRISLNTELESVRIDDVKGVLLSLSTVSFSTKTDDQTLALTLKVREPDFNYHHHELLYWLTVLKSLENEQSPRAENSTETEAGFLELYLATRSVIVILDVGELTAGIPLEQGGFMGGLRYSKVRLDVKPTKYEPGLTNRNVKCEVLLDTLYCQRVGSDVQLSRNRHDWGTVCYLGSLSAKLNQSGANIALETTVDTVRLEWSTQAVETVVSVLRSMRITPSVTYDNDDHDVVGGRSRDQDGEMDLTLSGKVTNVNLFVTNNQQHFLVFRVDSISADREHNSNIIYISGCKNVLSRQRLKPYNIVSTSEIKDYIGHVLEVRIIVNVHEKEICLNVMDDIPFRWTPGFQMMLYQVQQDVKTLEASFREYRAGMRGKKKKVPTATLR